jgi:hypothetical protein
MTRWTIELRDELRVVGHNHEMADYDNPRGEIIRIRYSVIATDDEGHRRFWDGGFETPEDAELAYALFAPPVELWEVVRPAYGSQAYAANWREYEADEIARERDQEFSLL